MPSLLRTCATAICGTLAGCAAFTGMGFEGAGAHSRPRIAGTPFLDWKGVVHCHSHLSHDSDGTLEQIAAACREARLDFLVMTDHQTDESIRDGVRGMVGDTLFLVGAEVRSPIGTLLCFPLQRPLRHFQHPALLAKEAAEQGGLSFAAHAELWRAPLAAPGLHGAEIVNLHAGAMTAGKLGTLGTALFLPIRSLCERISLRDDAVLAAWDEALLTKHPFTPIGGNDAHANIQVLGPLGGTIADYREVFLTLSTHVLAERLDEQSIVEAFAAGRTYVSFDVFGEGTGFDFRAVDALGVHGPGSSVSLGPELSLQVTVPDEGCIRLLRDGTVVDEIRGRSARWTALEGGVHRVEVWRDGDLPWLFSSSIAVVPPGAATSADEVQGGAAEAQKVQPNPIQSRASF